MHTVFISDEITSSFGTDDINNVRAMARAKAMLGSDGEPMNDICKKLYGHKLDDVTLVKTNEISLTTKNVADALGIGIKETNERLCSAGLQSPINGRYKLTDKGHDFGGYLETGQRKIGWSEAVLTQI